MKESSQSFAELTAAENVEMEVMDGLASIGATVGNNAVTVADACASGDHGNVFEYVSDFSARILGDVFKGVHVHFGNDKNVDGCLRVQVLEREDLVVLINFGRRDETCGNFTKNTIFHNCKPFLLYNYFGREHRSVRRGALNFMGNEDCDYSFSYQIKFI